MSEPTEVPVTETAPAVEAAAAPPALATREQFLNGAVARRYANVALPVSGLTVRVRSLTELERSRHEQAILDSKGERIAARVRDSRIRLIVLCLVDERGDRLLNDTDVEQVGKLDMHDTKVLTDFLWDWLGFGNSGVATAVKN